MRPSLSLGSARHTSAALAAVLLLLVARPGPARAGDLPPYSPASIDIVVKRVGERLKQWGERETRWVTRWDTRGGIGSDGYDGAKKLYPATAYERWKPEALQPSPYTDERAAGRIVIDKAAKKYWVVQTVRGSTAVRIEPTGLIEVTGRYVLLEGAADGGYKHAGVVNFGLVRQQDRGLDEDTRLIADVVKASVENMKQQNEDMRTDKRLRKWDGPAKAAHFWVVGVGDRDGFGGPSTREKAAVGLVTTNGAWTVSLSVDFGFPDARAEKYVRAGVPPLLQLAREIDDALKPSGPARPPVVVLPGVMGSALKTEAGDRVWPSPSGERMTLLDNHAINSLRCDSDGTPVARLNVTEALRAFPTDFYGAVVSHLTRAGYTEGTDLAVFAYDWRLGCAAHLDALDAVVGRLDSSEPVTLVAHSMGGLVARAYVLSDRPNVKRVGRIISVGTPYHGAPLALKALVEGHAFHWSLREDSIKRIVANMPGVYHLAPNWEFVTDAAARPVARDVLGSAVVRGDPFDLATGVKERALNEQLLARADAFRKGLRLGERTGAVTTHAIIGYGRPTLNGFSLRPLTEHLRDNKDKREDEVSYLRLKGGEKMVLVPASGSGDGTVPFRGAELRSAHHTHYVADRADEPVIHDQLLKNKRVLNAISEILAGRTPASDPAPGGNPVPASTEYKLQCAAVMRLTDAQGRAVGHLNERGKEGAIETNGPGASFVTVAGTAYGIVTDSGVPRTVTLTGTRDGKATLTVTTRRNGAVSGEFTYRDVLMTAGTVAEVTFTPDALDGTVPDLRVTRNGQTSSHPAEVRVKPTRAPRAAPAPVAPAPVEPPAAEPPAAVRGAPWGLIAGGVVLAALVLAGVLLAARAHRNGRADEED